VFPKILENDPNIWLTDNQIIVSGKISTKDADTKILVDKVQELNEDDLKKYKPKKNYTNKTDQFALPTNEPKASPPRAGNILKLLIPKSLKKEDMQKIKDVLLEYSGKEKVQLSIRVNGDRKKIILKNRIQIKKELLSKLEYILGKENIEY
ncbi:MAG: hypothetical protein ABH837_03145, partial [bacterium]